jgi:hypothetical protein
MKKLSEDRAAAAEVCNITGTQSSGASTIYCRCGQVDVCANSGDNIIKKDDLEAKPAILEVTALYLEEYIGPGNPNYFGIDPLATSFPPRYANPLINTPKRHRLVVSLDAADEELYQSSLDASERYLSPSERRAKSILYTRLIEVCPVNMAEQGMNASNWRAQTSNTRDNCMMRRVDGDLTAIRKPFILDLPEPLAMAIIDKGEETQGPWTVRFRTINDVCNRTYGDNTLSGNGQVQGAHNLPDIIYPRAGATAKQCGSGAACLTTRENDCVTGKFGGVTTRGNAPDSAYGDVTAGAVKSNSLNYCNVTAFDGSAGGAAGGIIGSGQPQDYKANNDYDAAVQPVEDSKKGTVVGGYPGVDHTEDNKKIGEFIGE